jgi:hypothetical protein
MAVRNLITTTNDESYHSSASELPPTTSHGYAEWDFSGVPDPVMFQQFLDASNYWFGCSDDSSIRRYDPVRECLMVVVDEHADGANETGVGAGDAPQNPRPSAPPTSPTGGADIAAQLAQAHELEDNLAVEYRQVRLMRAAIAGEASVHSERTRELDTRERINVDFNVDDPHAPPRAQQRRLQHR